MRTRDVLDICRQHHLKAIETGAISPLDVASPPPNAKTTPPPAPQLDLLRAWEDWRAQHQAPSFADDDYARLLTWGCRAAATERRLAASVKGADVLDVELSANDARAKLAIALCNKKAQGGGLGTQIEGADAHASRSGARLVLVRCSEYPPAGKTQIAKKLGELVKKGARKVIAHEADWRAVHALRAFYEKHESAPGFLEWVQSARPAANLDLFRDVLDEPIAIVSNRPPPKPQTTPPPAPAAAPPPRADGALLLGTTRSLQPKDVTLDPSSLVRHAAFLGSSGSGKTTLALNVIEQCLVRGVPALLIDRKGDLCSYGLKSFWEDSTPQKERLRKAVHVRVYTPGHPKGRPLRLPVLPSGLSELPHHERAQVAGSAAAGLASMMGYKSTQQDQARTAILSKAIELLAGPGEIELEHVVTLLADEDAALVDAIGRLDTKHFKALVDHLESLRLRHASLLKGEGERLTPELLFSAPAGKTALTIVSTKFLPDALVVDFWVSRLLVELARWGSRRPSTSLQALVLFDEADIYLPATSKPATKQPMQDLLRRARSAGMGILLATQSPGDFDYKCRDNIGTWFVGRVAQETAIEKMKPLLSEHRGNPGSKLAAARAGEFFLLGAGAATELKAQRSIMDTKQLGEDEILAVARGA